jgi:dolichol-phosphate mannosyltransferase
LGRRCAFQNVQRFFRFNVIGLVGIVFQLALLWILTDVGVGYLVASSAAIVVTVGHNFAWHWLWTWADRTPRMPPAIAFARFFLANGLVSLMSNLALMPLVAGRLGLPAVPSNLIVIAVAGVLNFGLADRVAFRAAPVSSEDADPDPAPHGA